MSDPLLGRLVGRGRWGDPNTRYRVAEKRTQERPMSRTPNRAADIVEGTDDASGP